MEKGGVSCCLVLSWQVQLAGRVVTRQGECHRSWQHARASSRASKTRTLCLHSPPTRQGELWELRFWILISKTWFLTSTPFLLIYGSGWDWKRVFRVLGKCVACNARKRPFCISNYLRLLAIVLGPKNSTNNSWGLINTIDFGMVSERVVFSLGTIRFLGFWCSFNTIG